ncbi:MAG TPA: bifunctional UDP-sugar hydrolase/5'-nucleotidase, partial [Longimicrobiales bacterium]
SWSNGRKVGGAATLTSYFKLEAEGADRPAVILDGGDVMQGTPISNLTKGRSTVSFFNAAGYRGVAIGNHDFDWTVSVLRARMAQAKFRWLSANVFVAGTDRQPAWAKPTALIAAGDVKIGIIGLSTEDTPITTKASNVVGLEFRSGSAAIDKWTPVLRKAGADFVIVVAHSGALCDASFTKCEGEIVEWARNTHDKPDLIVAGHTHRLVKWVENGIPIVEAGSYTTRYGVIDLARDSAGVHTWIHDFPTPFEDRVTPDPAVAALVAKAEREIGPQVKRVIATFADTIRRAGSGEAALGNLIADAFRASANAQLSFVNNGSIRIAELPAGPTTWGTLYSLQPFENRIVVLTMSGAQVRDVVEFSLRGSTPDMHISGMKVSYDAAAPAGRRVQRMTLLSGEEIQDNGSYTVSVTDFLATGSGDGYRAFGQARRRTDTNLTDLEALIHYLQALPQPVRVDLAERRFQSVPNQ